MVDNDKANDDDKPNINTSSNNARGDNTMVIGNATTRSSDNREQVDKPNGDATATIKRVQMIRLIRKRIRAMAIRRSTLLRANPHANTDTHTTSDTSDVADTKTNANNQCHSQAHGHYHTHNHNQTQNHDQTHSQTKSQVQKLTHTHASTKTKS